MPRARMERYIISVSEEHGANPYFYATETESPQQPL